MNSETLMSLQTLRAALVAAVVLALPAAFAQSAHAKPDDSSQPRQLSVTAKPWTGDFDRMLERRVIRFDVPFSRTLYYNDKGRERGLAAELARDFEQFVNRKHAKQLGKRPLTVYLIPSTRDELLPDLLAGLSDVSVGNLTITPERQKLVDFYAPPERKAMQELLVTGPASPPIAGPDDLAGKTVHVRKSSSYYESLAALNTRLKAAGKPEATLVVVPDALEDEDLMEMVDAGLLQAIVVDDWKALMWAQALPKIKVRADIVLRDGAHTGWAVRKDSPKLMAELDDFYRNWAAKQGVVEYRMAQAMKRVKALKDPMGTSDWRRFEETLALFRKYGDKYNFDPLMLAAQGYQESTLDQSKKSHVGAIGVMQIMPDTGTSLKVGDIRVTESNIHGGTKYMDQLMSKYFPDANFSEGNRPLFAFAGYNAGPGNIAKARKETEKRGLDPDKWFNNVEIVVAERIGTETTTYVRNIYKYYVSYRLGLEQRAELEKAKRQFAAPKG
jgi:membrane-bound lytic murein transglycosylase MltF